MATPFPFGSGNVLTAAQMNAITTLPVSTKTTSYTLTVADLGTRVVMNSASATTITVNTSIFGASDVVEILNIGAGVCTVTAGTCTVGTTGTLALVQNAGGTLTFISASASVFTASGVTASAGGLVAVVPTVAVGSGSGSVSATGTVTFTGASSVSVNNCFSATYTNYVVLMNWFTAVSADPTLRWRVGGVDNSTASSYVCSVASTSASAWSVQTDTASSATFSYSSGSASTAKTETLLYIYEPFPAVQTRHNQNNAGTLSYGQQQIVGKHNQSTSYDGFSILSSSNLTGTLTVYGYAL